MSDYSGFAPAAGGRRGGFDITQHPPPGADGEPRARPPRPAPTLHLTQEDFERLRRIERMDEELARLSEDARLARLLVRGVAARDLQAVFALEDLVLEPWHAQKAVACALEEADDQDVAPELRAAAELRVHPERLPDLREEGALRQVAALAGAAPASRFAEGLLRAEAVQTAVETLYAAPEPPLVRAFRFLWALECMEDCHPRIAAQLLVPLLDRLGYRAARLVDATHHAAADGEAYRQACGEPGRPDSFFRHLLGAVESAYGAALEQARAFDGSARTINERQWGLVEWFAKRRDPVEGLRFREVHRAFSEIPERTLKRDLATLRDEGLLQTEGRQKGTRYRAAAGLRPSSR